ncbi:putative EF-hand domain-containing family member C2-like [Trypanosoma grayi]|uniref:putative EF-hand domain-containing family member C2-like n=1 Tax=Trypanosoma grayi TaxID=71804 RepID=UPI0004F479FD|nr:putative EF-hand domain-containing family member C2-like [Trypanosoma grayi]KEG13591.1 putative EF-hand domain-containing family member C2-like [Trypanosoma grayi]
MKKEFALPMVPGMTCGEEMLRRNYHRTQINGPKYDTMTSFKSVPIDMTASNMQTMSSVAKYASGIPVDGTDAAQGTMGSTQSAVDLTGRVLRFYGYTKEQVPESSLECERLRKVIFHVFLEDNTMSVTEQCADNSGFAFPASLKRHIVPLPDGTPITFAHFRVGDVISFYGRTYMVYDADKFTRDFYSQAGVELAPPQEVPLDAYTRLRNRPVAKAHDVRSIAADSPLNNMLLPEQVRASQQFLAHDGEVLRCDCVWDDTEALHGVKHYFTLYYFLADGSIAVVEKDFPNSGRDPFPRFFRRQRVAKPKDGMKFDPQSLGSLTFKEDANTVYYTDEDIRIGNILNLFGRDVCIHDYDEYTRNHLRKKFGVTAYEPIPGGKTPATVPIGCRRREKTVQELEEAQERQRAENRMREFADGVVKFLMRLDNTKYEDELRRFVLAVYPADNTISIFEPVQRNSGIVGGKFLQRQRCKRPGGEFYTADDFYVGARLTINNFPFILLSSDEHSLNYMETNCKEFSRSDINQVVRKLRAMLASKQTGLASAFHEADTTNKGGLKMDIFLSIMKKLCLDISEQEVLSVLRYFDKHNESYVSYEEFVGRVMPEGAAVASDDRPWEAIAAEDAEKESAAFVKDPSIDEARRAKAQETALAARAAAEFLELYDQRRQLLLKEFRAVTDYSAESVVGPNEFKMCIRKKLQIHTITDAELNALCSKLFPKEMPQLSLEELVRVFNGTSTLPRNMYEIRQGVSR